MLRIVRRQGEGTARVRMRAGLRVSDHPKSVTETTTGKTYSFGSGLAGELVRRELADPDKPREKRRKKP